MTKTYFCGCSGIVTPVDMNGCQIVEGDQLTWDYGDLSEAQEWMRKPIFTVERHEGGGLCARGIDKPLFLHDFRFKYTQRINNEYLAAPRSDVGPGTQR